MATLRTALDTLASLPSIVYGLFGFLVFVVQMEAGYSLFAGAFVLALLNLPLVVGVAEESLRAVPRELEDASLALGATQVQTVRHVTLPYAWPGILSALVLSIGRVFAESAPLIMTAGTTISRGNAYSLYPLRGGETLAVHLWYVNSAGLSPDKADVSAGTAAVLVILVALTNVLAARLARYGGALGGAFDPRHAIADALGRSPGMPQLAHQPRLRGRAARAPRQRARHGGALRAEPAPRPRRLLEPLEELAAEVKELDRLIDRDEMEIDALVLRILALRQPVAYDLRLLATALKLVTDLERIGDEAVNIAERAEEDHGSAKELARAQLKAMADQAQQMLRDALDAFVEGDVTRAEQVSKGDDAVDALYGQTLRDMMAFMQENHSEIPGAIRVIKVAKYIERVADHATNIAEEVIFMVRGEDVRHVRTNPPGVAKEGNGTGNGA